MPDATIKATIDVIETIAGIDPGSPVAATRRKKQNLVAEAQAYYDALFASGDPGDLPLRERALIAVRVASHTRSPSISSWYEAMARSNGASDANIDAASSSAEPIDGPDDRRLAIMRHVDHLVRDPTSSSPAHLETLSAAGLSPANIVTLSQIVAFITYQIRVVAVLRALGGTS